LGFATLRLAILSTLIFNALISLALHGVKHKATGTANLLYPDKPRYFGVPEYCIPPLAGTGGTGAP
jgi:high-affinity K+ transport system ATPase subunit B